MSDYHHFTTPERGRLLIYRAQGKKNIETVIHNDKKCEKWFLLPPAFTSNLLPIFRRKLLLKIILSGIIKILKMRMFEADRALTKIKLSENQSYSRFYRKYKNVVYNRQVIRRSLEQYIHIQTDEPEKWKGDCYV